MAKKLVPHVVSPYKVWIIEGNRVDNGNALYYIVWGDNAELAEQYLLSTDLKGIEVNLTSTYPLTNGVYEHTLNCKLNHPERYYADGRHQDM